MVKRPDRDTEWMHFSGSCWLGTMAIAIEAGWERAGTIPSAEYEEEQINDVMTQDSRGITPEELATIARYLEKFRASDHREDYSRPGVILDDMDRMALAAALHRACRRSGRYRSPPPSKLEALVSFLAQGPAYLAACGPFDWATY